MKITLGELRSLIREALERDSEEWKLMLHIDRSHDHVMALDELPTPRPGAPLWSLLKKGYVRQVVRPAHAPKSLPDEYYVLTTAGSRALMDASPEDYGSSADLSRWRMQTKIAAAKKARGEV